MSFFQVEKNEKYTVIKTKVEKLDTAVAPSLKSEMVMLNSNHGKAHNHLTNFICKLVLLIMIRL